MTLSWDPRGTCGTPRRPNLPNSGRWPGRLRGGHPPRRRETMAELPRRSAAATPSARPRRSDNRTRGRSVHPWACRRPSKPIAGERPSRGRRRAASPVAACDTRSPRARCAGSSRSPRPARPPSGAPRASDRGPSPIAPPGAASIRRRPGSSRSRAANHDPEATACPESHRVRLKEEVDEGPFRERVSSEGQRLVHGEPPDVLDFVRLQAERVGSDVALIHESQGVRRLAGEPGYVDVQEAVQSDAHANLLLRLALDADLGALAIVHESAGDVPISLRETADRLDHEHPRAVREDYLGDAANHRGIDRALHERVDIGPLENCIPTQPLFRVVIESRLLPQHAVGAEVHHAVRFSEKRQFFASAGKPQVPMIADEIDLAVRLDEEMFAACPLTHATGSMPMRCIKWSREELVKAPTVMPALKGGPSSATRGLSGPPTRHRGAVRSTRSSAGPSLAVRCSSGWPGSRSIGSCGPRRRARGRCP